MPAGTVVVRPVVLALLLADRREQWIDERFIGARLSARLDVRCSFRLLDAVERFVAFWDHGHVQATSDDPAVAAVTANGAIYAVAAAAVGETEIHLSTVPNTPPLGELTVSNADHAAARGTLYIRVIE